MNRHNLLRSKARALKFLDYFQRVFLAITILFPVLCIRKVIPVRKCMRVWIFSERKDEARDNAYALFRYVQENVSDIVPTYAIEQNTIDSKKFGSDDHVVRYGSLRHYWIYANSEVTVSTHVGGELPAGKAVWLLNWLDSKKCKVFVRHGISKDHYTMYQKKYLGPDMITFGARAEYEYYQDKIGYRSYEMALTGLCRFDSLTSRKSEDHSILYMPTFRKNLHELSRLSLREQEVSVKQTEYFHGIQSVLLNRDIIAFLEATDRKILLFVHPSAQFMLPYFQKGSDRIEVLDRGHVDIGELISTCDALITDYSSIFFDFAYLEKPVIYFQFDEKSYRRSHYKKGYFDYVEDGFGPVVRDVDALCQKLWGIDWPHSSMDESIYGERRSQFFMQADGFNCKRTVDAIRKHPKLQ